ncbi:MAG: hypothetical protein WC217_00590 [Candidatus Paceibacterota bacterium]
MARLVQKVKSRQPHTLVIVGACIASFVAIGIFVFSPPARGETSDERVVVADSNGIVAVVGENSATGTPSVGNSWPAELISSDIVQVQPQREGTIVDWRVHIGELVGEGEILGHISAPPATPEIIKMLADQTEALTGADAGVRVADEYTAKEKARLAELSAAIGSSSSTVQEGSFPALASIRAQVAVKQSALRSVVERALSEQIALVTNVTDWRYVRYGSFNRQYGSLNQAIQNSYEPALIALSSALQKGGEVPVSQAQEYFALAVRIANSTPDDLALNALKVIAVGDQKDFLDAVAEYRDAQMALADKETEYRLMIQEKNAMLEKDRSMAQSSAEASRAAYKTVEQQIRGGTAIVASRSGIVSSIAKKVGDLVSPDMAIAVIAGSGQRGLTVRMRIPSTSMRPAVGDVLSVMRPGFPADTRRAKLIGVGAALDGTGSYMADAVLTEAVNWPVSSSVRVLAPERNGITVKSSAVKWGEGGAPQVWVVSSGGRIFAKKISIGRTLGDVTEVYSGLSNGERYIAKPEPDIREDMLLDELLKTLAPEKTAAAPSAGSGGMGDMPM